MQVYIRYWTLQVNLFIKLHEQRSVGRRKEPKLKEVRLPARSRCARGKDVSMTLVHLRFSTNCLLPAIIFLDRLSSHIILIIFTELNCLQNITQTIIFQPEYQSSLLLLSVSIVCMCIGNIAKKNFRR